MTLPIPPEALPVPIGPRGDRGPRGHRGPPGIAIQMISEEANEWLLAELTAQILGPPESNHMLTTVELLVTGASGGRLPLRSVAEMLVAFNEFTYGMDVSLAEFLIAELRSQRRVWAQFKANHPSCTPRYVACEDGES